MTTQPIPHGAEVLVTGASGLIGQAVVSALLKHGMKVKAFVRSGNVPIESPFLTIVKGDLKNSDDVQRAVHGVSYVIHLAARKSDEADSEKVNIEGTKYLVNACEKENIRLFIHVSTPSAALQSAGTYGRTKRQSEEIVRASKVPYVIVRPSIVYAGFEAGILKSIRGFLGLPIVPVIGKGTVTYAPIQRDDLAELFVQMLTEPEVIGHTYDVGGPEVLSFNDMVHVSMNALHIKKPLFHLPVWLAFLLARVFSILPHPPVTVSNVRGALEDVPLHLEPLRSIIPYQARTLRDGLMTDAPSTKNDNYPMQEAGHLLTYILGSTGCLTLPDDEECQRYMDACAVHHIDPTHRLPTEILESPRTLSALDASSRFLCPHAILQQKLLIAAAIAETSPRSADALLPRNRSPISFFAALCGVALRSLSAVIHGFLFAILRRSSWKTYVGY